jgi:hypothetical protein
MSSESWHDTWIQGVFNDLAKSGSRALPTDVPVAPSSARLFAAFNGKLLGGVLPLALFCGGHSYFVAQIPQRRGVLPYSVRTNRWPLMASD